MLYVTSSLPGGVLEAVVYYVLLEGQALLVPRPHDSELSVADTGTYGRVGRRLLEFMEQWLMRLRAASSLDIDNSTSLDFGFLLDKRF